MERKIAKCHPHITNITTNGGKIAPPMVIFASARATTRIPSMQNTRNQTKNPNPKN